MSKLYDMITEQQKGHETEPRFMIGEQLKEIALKRIEFKELSFSDLGRQMNPPISKSGVCHRLEKILKFYEESKDK